MPCPLACSVARRSFTGRVFSPVSCERRAQMDCRASARPSRTCWRAMSRCRSCSFVLVVAEEFGQHFELNRNADITLGESVVNFAGDAVAFGEDGVEFAFGAQKAKAQGEDNTSRGSKASSRR